MLISKNCLDKELLEKWVCGPCSLWSVALLVLFFKEISAAASPFIPSFLSSSPFLSQTHLLLEATVPFPLDFKSLLFTTREQEKTLCVSQGLCSLYNMIYY